MPARRRRSLRLVKQPPRYAPVSPEMDRALEAAAGEVARELGRQAAREVFAKMIQRSTKAS